MNQAAENADWKLVLLERVRTSAFRHFPDLSYRRIHLAVFEEPYLTLVLEGKKTLESRFSINRCAPYQSVFRGDLILLKRPGGAIEGIVDVREAEYLCITGPEQISEIAAAYSSDLCVTDAEFWEAKRRSAYCTLLRLGDPIQVRMEDVGKRDRMAWVTLDTDQLPLFGRDTCQM